MSDNTSTAYHPNFSDSSADIVLRSSDGTLFRIHSIILKLASSFFTEMFEVATGDGEPIAVEEEAVALQGLLALIHPGATMPVLEDFQIVEGMVLAAKKYGMPGPMSTIRSFLSCEIPSMEPLQLYTLACRVGWNDIADTASTRTIPLDLLSPSSQRMVESLGMKDFVALQRLHRERKDQFRKEVNGNGPSTKCDMCIKNKSAAEKGSKWLVLKDRILAEFERRPLGDTLTTGPLLSGKEAEACWVARRVCPHHANFSRVTVSEWLEIIVARLPRTVSSKSVKAPTISDDICRPQRFRREKTLIY